jgi:hypothetical protein
VALDHNQPTVVEIVKGLASLEKDILTVNDVGAFEQDDREAAVAEIGAIKSLLSRTRVRVSAVLSQAEVTLGWIAKKAGEAAIGEAAKNILRLIISWLT